MKLPRNCCIVCGTPLEQRPKHSRVMTCPQPKPCRTERKELEGVAQRRYGTTRGVAPAPTVLMFW